MTIDDRTRGGHGRHETANMLRISTRAAAAVPQLHDDQPRLDSERRFATEVDLLRTDEEDTRRDLLLAENDERAHAVVAAATQALTAATGASRRPLPAAIATLRRWVYLPLGVATLRRWVYFWQLMCFVLCVVLWPVRRPACTPLCDDEVFRRSL
jgi:hypothetical protein